MYIFRSSITHVFSHIMKLPNWSTVCITLLHLCVPNSVQYMKTRHHIKAPQRDAVKRKHRKNYGKTYFCFFQQVVFYPKICWQQCLDNALLLFQRGQAYSRQLWNRATWKNSFPIKTKAAKIEQKKKHWYKPYKPKQVYKYTTGLNLICF